MTHGAVIHRPMSQTKKMSRRGKRYTHVPALEAAVRWIPRRRWSRGGACPCRASAPGPLFAIGWCLEERSRVKLGWMHGVAGERWKVVYKSTLIYAISNQLQIGDESRIYHRKWILHYTIHQNCIVVYCIIPQVITQTSYYTTEAWSLSGRLVYYIIILQRNGKNYKENR